ncbi:TetR/AcrR family transcriptional regulator [Gordonia sp. SL306]|uniref:TetR/AcrR family transcriptional regulator n=1 Tax=Gordonia sp. SL306 TaxID=2995145 RepID=UPI00226D7E3F|nr:hypothetical protein [Gordonia sp. SL306]WAC56778.1 hypothetical protein OVA31_05870 [Gordonia sp. SL306]
MAPRNHRQRERRRKFGEASIEIIATHGLRALTHRAVDETAGFPIGSVNYYAPTRAKLLALALETVHEELQTLAAESFGPLLGPGPHDQRTVVECGTNFVDTARRKGLAVVTARQMLLAEAQFYPELGELIESHRRQLIELSVVVGAPFEPARPEEAATIVVALMDGLLQQLVVGKYEAFTRPMIRLAMSRICNIGSESSRLVGAEQVPVRNSA